MSGCTNKFVTLTGNVIRNVPVAERTAEIRRVLESYMLRPQRVNQQPEELCSQTGSLLSDNEVLEKAMVSKNSAKFGALWNGDFLGKSHSEADLALCSMLAFWCGGDTAQMDRLFRQSALYRQKWERKDYREETIRKAINGCTEFYSPGLRCSASEDFSEGLSAILSDFQPEANNIYPVTDIGAGRLFADGKILAHILASLRRITFGTAAGLGAALPVGILMGRIPAADRILGAFFRFLYPVPKVVFMPIVVVMLGIGDAAKIFLIFLAVFFQMTIIIRDSAASLEQELTDVMRSMNADRAAVLRHLVLPGILPGILTALKASLGTSVALLMITELFASTSGLGYFIMNSMDSRDYPQMYAGIVILALMSAVLYGVLEAAESILCKWHYVRRG